MTAVLWICGPPGSGKTTIAWRLHQELADVGYVDIDQLGMRFPEPPSDPGRFRLAADNLNAVIAGYRTAGTRAVIVSGVVDPARGVRVDRLPGVAVTTCRLRADPDCLRRRLTARRADAAYIEGALAEAAVWDTRGDAGLRVDTTGLPVEQVVALVRQRTEGWQEKRGTATPSPPPSPAGGSLLWLCGPTGVGKSTAGFPVFLRRLPGAFADLDQIGFYRAGAVIDHRMRAGILAAMWHNFGAERLTVVGPAENVAAIETYARTLPEAAITVCRLHASAPELARRIMLRGRGGGSWAQPATPCSAGPPSTSPQSPNGRPRTPRPWSGRRSATSASTPTG